VTAALCALAFLFLSFIHATQHSGAVAASSNHELVLSAADGPDPSEPASSAFEHCHGCLLIASALGEAPLILPSFDADQPIAPAHALHAHSPGRDTPPPIAAI
jgi:hypothetical protein